MGTLKSIRVFHFAYPNIQITKHDPSAWPKQSTSSQPPTWSSGKAFWRLRGPQSGIGDSFRLVCLSNSISISIEVLVLLSYIALICGYGQSGIGDLFRSVRLSTGVQSGTGWLHVFSSLSWLYKSKLNIYQFSRWSASCSPSCPCSKRYCNYIKTSWPSMFSSSSLWLFHCYVSIVCCIYQQVVYFNECEKRRLSAWRLFVAVPFYAVTIW